MHRLLLPLALLLCTTDALDAGIVTFDDLTDGTTVTNQYAGLTFSNTIVLSAGISLNEFEFPPRSGTNVASDNGGPITIVFSTAVTGFSAYVTYLTPLTLVAFDSMSNQIASTTSLFSNNLALSGDLSSNPNELLKLTFAGGINSVSITGDPAGGSFTLDDATFTTAAVPEPTSGILLAVGLSLLAINTARSRGQR